MMSRFTRKDELPPQMQGDWVDPEDGATLVIAGSDARFQGASIQYDWFEVEEKSGALCVYFGIDDPAREDNFVRENLVGLVIDPEGNFHGYNTKFGCTFVKNHASANV
ncbi:MAG: hypothetical protein EDM03_16100 [Porphyrobacter sp. IPPAS B-1204]|jgi:hypothetical protein|nr:MAG: hypothetical protein EDM03_16100 [Porphyrobacter sp. IPPAS B-1204]